MIYMNRGVLTCLKISSQSLLLTSKQADICKKVGLKSIHYGLDTIWEAATDLTKHVVQVLSPCWSCQLNNADGWKVAGREGRSGNFRIFFFTNGWFLYTKYRYLICIWHVWSPWTANRSEWSDLLVLLSMISKQSTSITEALKRLSWECFVKPCISEAQCYLLEMQAAQKRGNRGAPLMTTDAGGGDTLCGDWNNTENYTRPRWSEITKLPRRQRTLYNIEKQQSYWVLKYFNQLSTAPST